MFKLFQDIRLDRKILLWQNYRKIIPSHVRTNSRFNYICNCRFLFKKWEMRYGGITLQCVVRANWIGGICMMHYKSYWVCIMLKAEARFIHTTLCCWGVAWWTKPHGHHSRPLRAQHFIYLLIYDRNGHEGQLEPHKRGGDWALRENINRLC